MSTAGLPVSSSSPAPPAPTTATASSLLSKDVGQELQREIANLQSEDEQTLMKATASLVMLSTLPGAETHLASCVSRLVSFLIGDYSVHVQRNACAALTAIMNTNLILYNIVVETPNLMNGIIQCLKLDADLGLQVNTLGVVKLLAEHDQGLALLEESGVDDILLAFLDCTGADFLEEAVDVFCALAIYDRLRLVLLQKGAVSKLALHLETESPEVCVRVLLALGMLCGSSVTSQCELANADGAVKALLTLMRSTDNDIRLIARDLLSALTSNKESRMLVEQVMRGLQETQANS